MSETEAPIGRKDRLTARRIETPAATRLAKVNEEFPRDMRAQGAALALRVNVAAELERISQNTVAVDPDDNGEWFGPAASATYGGGKTDGR